ncbi:hypothetical protein BGW39_009586 [Mortierella sp. 14UC]|nr:hypothetical protein BGW39_009586 [Mortierella sp. 14UC]
MTPCGPRIQVASQVSGLSERYAGVVAAIGVNDDSIFTPKKPQDVEKVKPFLAKETIKNKFRYAVVVDIQHRKTLESIGVAVILKAEAIGAAADKEE